jgi:hypothetical protein
MPACLEAQQNQLCTRQGVTDISYAQDAVDRLLKGMPRAHGRSEDHYKVHMAVLKASLGKMASVGTGGGMGVTLLQCMTERGGSVNIGSRTEEVSGKIQAWVCADAA